MIRFELLVGVTKVDALEKRFLVLDMISTSGELGRTSEESVRFERRGGTY